MTVSGRRGCLWLTKGSCSTPTQDFLPEVREGRGEKGGKDRGRKVLDGRAGPGQTQCVDPSLGWSRLVMGLERSLPAQASLKKQHKNQHSV